MGVYFNPDNESFKSDVISQIYIDKTMMLEYTNKILGTNNRCFAVSHARRFGKSQAAAMLAAYYSCGCNSGELFAPFKISKNPEFAKHLNMYNVLHMDISPVYDYCRDDIVGEIYKRLIRDIKNVFGDEIYCQQSLSGILGEIYKKTRRKFIIILDEWDCIVRNLSDKQNEVHNYMRFLHDLFKSEEAKSFLALAYITGILPIKKIRDESALNNFNEFTMIESDELTTYFGFTEQEVVELCQQYNMDFESIRTWYNGYLISGQHMYNPNSVSYAMVKHALRSYWRNTSSYETINDYITMNFAGLKDDIVKMLSGGKVRVNTDNFQNDLSIINRKDDALTALIHLGYLGYNAERGVAYIPNYEVSTAFQSALGIGKWKEIAESINRCEDLLWATIDGETDKVVEYLQKAHEAYSSILKYNDENSMSCVVTMAYYTAPAYYKIVREFPAGKGFADFAFIPMKNAGSRPAMIVELKYDKDAETAIMQIKEKRYAGALHGYSDKILLVGINYNKNTKVYSCQIEEV